MGKVPAIRHADALVTEQIAIYLYLGDLFPEAGLTPAIGDPRRGPYLRWMVFYAACFEPALVDKSMQRDPGRPTASVYGDFDTMFTTLEAQIAKGPYILGDRLTVAGHPLGRGPRMDDAVRTGAENDGDRSLYGPRKRASELCQGQRERRGTGGRARSGGSQQPNIRPQVTRATSEWHFEPDLDPIHGNEGSKFPDVLVAEKQATGEGFIGRHGGNDDY